MKKILFAAILSLSFNVFSQTIPLPIEKLIKVYQYKSYSLDDGRLSVVIKKTEVTYDMIQLFFEGVCSSQYDKAWAPDVIKSVTLINIEENQSYTVKGGGNECIKMGKMNGDETSQYLKSLIVEN